MSVDFSGLGAKWIYRMVRILAVPLQELVEKLEMSEEQILEVVRLVECQRTVTRSGLSPESMTVQSLETHIDRLETFYSMAMSAYADSTGEVTTTREVKGVETSSTRPGRPQGSYLQLAMRMSKAIVEAYEKLAKLPREWKARAVAESRVKLDWLNEPDDSSATHEQQAAPSPEDTNHAAQGHAAQNHDAQNHTVDATRDTIRDSAHSSDKIQSAARDLNSTPNHPTRLSKAERRERSRPQTRREELLVTQT